MEQRVMKAAELRLADKNVRRHPKRQIEALKESYRMFGQYRPLVVDSDGTILVGNGMFQALSELGVNDIEVKVLPPDTPESTKKKLMLADNKTQSIGIDDLTVIEEFMIDLPDFDIPGYESDILEELYGDTASVDSYGIIDDARVAKINERANETASTGLQEVSATQYAKEIESLPYVNPEVTEAERHAGDYITCPNCGLKIWR